MRPIISIPLDVTAAKNRSNKFVGPLSLGGRFAPRKDFRAPFFIHNESLVAAGLDAVVDAHVPVLERRPDGFDLAFDALLDGRKNDPALRSGELAFKAAASNKTARFF